MMRNKYILIAFALCLVITSLVTISAADSDLTFKRGQDIDLKIPCISNNTYCSGSSWCNITINYPNGTNLVNNAQMTNSDSFHNYTLISNYTKVVGHYYSSVVCYDSGEFGYTTFYFDITTTGAQNEWLMNVLFFVVLLLSIILFIIGLNRQDPWITMLSGFLFVISGLFIYFYPLSYLPTILNKGFAFVMWGLGGYILIRTGIEVSSELP